jgi:uncharacterized protein (TIGR00299 family) protein
MILGALVDAGLPVAELQTALDGLKVAGITLRAESVKRGAFRGTLVRVETEEHGHPHRHLPDILKILEGADIPTEVRDDAVRIFRRLAEAEATAHGVPVEKIHFHEVGALDAIADIVGGAWGIRRLGLAQVYVSPLNTGSGFVKGAHGTMPVPAPGTAALLAGIPSYSSGVQAELTTPTGAAILTTLAAGFGPMPAMVTDRIGYGAGQREFAEQPNLLRLVIGESVAAHERDQVAVLEANIDDMNPQFFEPLLDRLFEAGALDAFLSPLLMKKSRPASLLTVLAEPERAESLVALILAHTTTFGVRTYSASRWKRRRDFVTVQTPFGEVRIKRGWDGEQVAIASPEFEDCRKLAQAAGVPVQAVYDAAKRAAQDILQTMQNAKPTTDNRQ